MRDWAETLSARATAGVGRAALWLRVDPLHLLLAVLGILLSALSRLAASDGPLVRSPAAVPLWVGGIALVMLGLRRKEDRSPAQGWAFWEIVFALAIGLASLAVRGWNAGSWPHVLSSDEASVGMTAWEFRTGERNNPLALGWWSYPSLYFWMVSLSQAIFGRTIEAIRWPSALGGALTVVALYASARSIFGRTMALWSALWLMGFHHHLFFSRVAYNNIWDGLFFITAVGCIWRGWSEGRRSSYLWAGLALGLGQYFYTTSRLTLLVVGLWLVALHRMHRQEGSRSARGDWADVLCLALVACSVTLPLALCYLTHPEALWFTAERVTLFAPGWQEVARTLGLSPLGLVVEQMWVTALGFLIGELQGVYYAPGVPLLFSLSAVFFVIGLVLCVLRLRDPRHGLLLMTMAGTVLIGGLSIQAPNGQRMMLLPPVVALMTALPLEEVRVRFARSQPSLHRACLLLGTGLVAVMVAQNLRHFFLDYLPHESYGSLNAEVAQELARFLSERGEPLTVYFIGGERMSFHSLSSLIYLFPEASGQDLAPPYDLPRDGRIGMGRPVFITLPEQARALQAVVGRYGPGETMRRYNQRGQLLFTAFVPQAAEP